MQRCFSSNCGMQQTMQKCTSTLVFTCTQERKQGSWGKNTLWAWYFTKTLLWWECIWLDFFTKIREVRLEEYAYFVKKLRLKTWIWRQKQRTPNTNDHRMPLNENPPRENFLSTPLHVHYNSVQQNQFLR